MSKPDFNESPLSSKCKPGYCAALSLLLALPAVAGESDLRIESVTLDKSIASDPQFVPGQKIRLEVRVANRGDASSRRKVPVAWYFGPVPNSRAHYISRGSLGGINGLQPGEVEIETDRRWRVPDEPGAYWLTAVLEESEQTVTTRFFVDGRKAADLQISGIEVAGGNNFVPGDEIGFQIATANAGTKATEKDVGVAWFLGTKPGDKEIPLGGTVIGERNGLSPQEGEVLRDLKFWTELPGEYWLTASIDPLNLHEEGNEANNELSVQFQVKGPDVLQPVSSAQEVVNVDVIPEQLDFPSFEPAVVPSPEILWPANGEEVPEPTLVVAGSAQEGILAVDVRLNGGAWQKASGTTNWVTEVSLLPGVNLVEARSVGMEGNFSGASTVAVVYNGNVAQVIQEPALAIVPPRFTAIGYADGQFVFEWEGTGILELAPTPSGPWEPVENATSPAVVRTDSPHYFFRLRVP